MLHRALDSALLTLCTLDIYRSHICLTISALTKQREIHTVINFQEYRNKKGRERPPA